MGKLQNINGALVEVSPPPGDGIAIGRVTRNLIQWNIPNRGVVEMYINPQSLSIQENKIIKETRTKGGYIIQYWGEQLPEIDISGTTGSSGIEGINVLQAVYRQEQITMSELVHKVNTGFLDNLFNSTIQALGSISNSLFTGNVSDIGNILSGINPLNISNAANISQSIKDPNLFLNNIVSVAGNVSNIIDNALNFISSAGGAPQLLPTLAALATSIEMWYDGMIYRGFFKNFRVEERADETGMFRYTIKFTVTRRTGVRSNSMPWHRNAESGPSDSDIIPLSFGGIQVTNTASTLLTSQTTNQTSPLPLYRRKQITGE